MKKRLLYLIVLVSAAGCVWENEETLYPELAVCDTMDVSFAADITSLLTNNCFSCHSNNNAPDFANGITFEDYDDVAASATLIIGAINLRVGFPEMPQNGEKLDTCLINTFEAWVNQGSLDN